MKKDQTKKTVVVGIFIFLGLCIFIAGVLVLGSQRKTFKKSFTVTAVFNDVSGLLNGNNVWFSGVKIGTVKNIKLIDSAQVEVEMRIEKEAQTMIKKDAKARIASDGLIGNRIVMIYGGTYAAEPVETGDTLYVENAIKSEDMMNTLQESNKNLLSITGNLKAITERLAEGQGSIGKLLTNDTFATRLQYTAGSLQAASADIRALASNLSDYTTKFNTKGSLANELVTDTSLFRTLQSASVRVKEASSNARELTENLKQVSYKLKYSSNLAGVVFNDEQTAGNLRLMVDNLRQGAEKFNDDMEALQHNFLLRGFFRKRAKRQQQEQQQEQKTVSFKNQ
jgi:phospholipid/cholesterol/gamma-HCH transport system substrate-binding protein